jgi:hypothetical protein
LAEANSREEKSAVAADLEASYSGLGFDVGSSVSSRGNSRRSSSNYSSSVTVISSGVTRGSGVRSLDLSQAEEELINFADIAQQGTGIATELRSYNSHPDYLETLSRCSGGAMS